MCQSLSHRFKRTVSAFVTLFIAALATTLVEIQPAAAQFSFYDYGYQNPFRDRKAYRYRQPAPVYQPRRQTRREPERTRQAVAKPVTKPQIDQAINPVEQQIIAARVEQPSLTRPDISAGQSTTISRPLYAIISISHQKLTVYGADGPMLESKVSTGTAENPTPTGAFAIIQKNRWHESNLYSDSPMPFMQRITWSGVAMHHGKLPGYPASHGCIRLPWDFAEKWFGMTKLGLRIIVAPNDVAPMPITHVNLPQPRYWPVASEVTNQAAPGLGKTAQLRTVRNDQTMTGQSEPDRPAKLLDPQAYAAAERIRVKAAIKQSQQAEGEAESAARRAAETAEAAKDAARKASRQLAATNAPLTSLVTTGQTAYLQPDADFEIDLASALIAYTTSVS
jgi:lipoprotein-anchoring transpeptidase ErfK/SrfK